MATSPRLELPLLSSGQAQKELTHNEALILIDLLVQTTCTDGPLQEPPPAPKIGELYLCASNASGAWAGKASCLALWTTSGWRFAKPFEGQRFSAMSDGLDWRYSEGKWLKGLVNATEIRIGGKTVVKERQPAISQPSGGGTVDLEARTAIFAVIETLRAHGLIAE